jgi:signal transduction histidine kinase
MNPVTPAELKTVIALNELPDEHLQWIIDHSEYKEYEDGSQIKKTGEEADVLIMMLEGAVSFYMDVKGRLVFYHHFDNDKASGGITGVMPYSRMKTYPGCSFAVGKLRTLQLHKKYFTELEHLNPDFIQRLIGYMTERAKSFATMQMQQEKVSALGRLSAGIAHELNNPASAINRIASELTRRLEMNYQLTGKLLEENISAHNIHNIRNLAEEKKATAKIKLTAIQRLEREDEITEWLEQFGFTGTNQASDTFVDAGFVADDFEKLRSNLDKNAFIQVLHWLENLLSSERIINDLDEASTRISNLVGAIKSHVQMDRTNELHPTNIQTDIENTITLLGHKLREKSISVKKTFCENFPEVPAYVGELNQVWTNIIDNAIYAVPKNGEITIETICDDSNVTVKISDNGAGIPPEIISRIFDPFFTTKKVGDGTGIGLDIVNRIVKRHKGEIKVNSQPGKTQFSICIPRSQGK